MKTILKILTVIIITVSTSYSQFIKTDLQVAGLTCSMCSRAVDKQLRTLDFIDSVGIDLSTATFYIYYKKEKEVNFELIKKKVEDAGFSVASLKTTFMFNNFKAENYFHFVYQNTAYHFIKLIYNHSSFDLTIT